MVPGVTPAPPRQSECFHRVESATELPTADLAGDVELRGPHRARVTEGRVESHPRPPTGVSAPGGMNDRANEHIAT